MSATSTGSRGRSSMVIAGGRDGGGGVRQLSLPTLDDAVAAEQQPSGKSHQTSTSCLVDRDSLATVYLRRLEAQGAARAGFEAYRYQLESVLRTASRLRSEVISLSGLFDDAELLGSVLIDDTAPVHGVTLSKWTLAQRRSAVRSFGPLMRPELRELLGDDPLERIDDALRSVAERVGTGYHLTGGAPRRRGGYVPTPNEIAAVIDAAGRVAGYRGIRNRVFFELLVKTGTRVNALRELDGLDCAAMPSGRLRLFVHDKDKLEPREVELSLALSSGLQHYINAFNQLAAGRRWKTRINLGESGPVWRNSARGRWPYQAVLATLHQACAEAGVPEFSPHALRRAFATDATSVLPRHVVALAGGWQGLERFDDHYVHPHQSEIWNKLGWSMTDETNQWMNEQVEDESVITL